MALHASRALCGRRVRARQSERPGAATAEHYVAEGVRAVVREAEGQEERKAAAAVRAEAFNEYPEERSSFAVARHERLAVGMQHKSIEAKVRGTDRGYRGIEVECFVAALSGEGQPLERARGELHGATRLTTGEVAVGSLDVNVCGALPSERLAGAEKEGAAYLSNVCVVPLARGLGVGKLLVLRALAWMRERSLRVAYVHCARSNSAALGLYRSCGFEVEREEKPSPDPANPSRLLLRLRP